MSAVSGFGVPEGLARAPKVRVSRIGWFGLVAAIGMLAAVIGWMNMSTINGAIIASGEVVVRGQPKEVQSLEGGLVARILVAEGDRVSAGDPLLELDRSLIEIELDAERGRLAGALLEERRLQAEYLGSGAIDFAELPDAVAEADLDLERDGQETIFRARLAVLGGLQGQLDARIEQAGEEITGLDARIEALAEQRDLLAREIATTQSLVSKGLAPQSELLEFQGRHAALRGEIAALASARAQAEAGVRDARLEAVQAERRFRETAVTELRETSLERARFALSVATLENSLARTHLLAPVDGIVHDLRVATIGGVVPAGEAVMQIVPVGQGVEFSVRVDPRSIDAVHVGQEAKIVLPAFDARTTPEIFGTVSHVPPGAVTDPETRASHYVVALSIPLSELERLGEVELIPGMPVEAFLRTGERTVLSYLTRPIVDQMRRAMRED